MKQVRVWLLAAGLIVLGCKHAWAEGFALYEWGARGIALGGATMARSADPSAIASNPALITQLPGIQFQAGATAITPAGTMRFDDDVAGVHGSYDLKPATWVIPNMYYTQRLNDSFTIGVGEFSRFGLGIGYPKNWPGRYNVYNIELTTLSVNPVIAWKVNEALSLAAGVELMYLDIGLNKRVNPKFMNPNLGPVDFNQDPLDVDSDMEANSLGVGFNLGLHWQINPQWAFGLGYRSQVSHRAEGENDFTVMNPAVAPLLNPSYRDSDVHATVVLPDSVSGGLAWTPLDNLSLEAGAVWTRWSTFRSLRIHLEDPMDTVAESKKDWDDAWRFNFGVEYAPLDWLILRAGYAYDMSPMTERYEDYMIPTDGRNLYSAGVGFIWGAATIDLAYCFIDAKGRDYSRHPQDGVLKSQVQDATTHVVSLSLGYKF